MADNADLQKTLEVVKSKRENILARKRSLAEITKSRLPSGASSLSVPSVGSQGFTASPKKSAKPDETAVTGGKHSKAPVSEEIKNDYSQNFVNTGKRPQNFIRDADLSDRFEEFPKLRELVVLKDQLLKERNSPPSYLRCDLKSFDLATLGCKFDVILIDPPLEEFSLRAPGAPDNANWWSWDEISSLRIPEVCANPSFVFLWVGNTVGLEEGRLALKRWGFRRCEDIVWVKTNKTRPGRSLLKNDANAILQQTTEHCLMGIHGTVRRATDTHFIHANVDTDVIISEEPEYGSTHKPEELYHIIEHFCLGRRRLELFATDANIRPGWLSLGQALSSSNFNAKTFASQFEKSVDGTPGHLLGSNDQIDQLRPQSPPPRGGKPGKQ